MAKIGIVNVTKKVTVNGVWKLAPAVMGGNHRLRPDVVLVNGVEETHTEGRYYIDYLKGDVRKRLAAGKTAAEATAFAEKVTRELKARAAAAEAGLEFAEPVSVVRNTDDVPKGKRSLEEMVAVYLLEVQSHKKPKTLSAYRTTLTYFLESCKRAAVEDVTRTDLLHFITHLRKKGQSDRSVSNKFENLMSFLKWSKVRVELSKNDWPKYVEEEVSVYSQDELDRFFAACTETEYLWFQFFLKTAMREQEVMNADWSWLDFERSVITVRENGRTGFKPKAYKGRLIPVDSELLSLLKNWKAKQDSTCGLIFPTAGCKPKLDFLDECKAIAKRAGLTDFYLHKFRATRATQLLQAGIDIKSVQKILGHSDMESTMRYLGHQQTDVLQAQIERLNAQTQGKAMEL
jgi:integrase